NEGIEVDGIILQLPISDHLSKHKLLDTIALSKDVDGLNSASAAIRRSGSGFAVVPATARGVMELLKYYKIDPKGKKVAVLGRSELAGGPIAEAMKKAGAKVTICHSHTYNEEDITRKSDIVAVAIGKPKFVNENFFVVGKGQVVVDVGINTVAEKNKTKLLEEVSGQKFVGDVDFDKVAPLVAAISPVPGGVGQMTVLGLFENLVDCFEATNKV
ncbi:MAG: bifunctional 5,10-methylenetetrahydrofolate dehydrogenase/5,10-methenyltetrahydrofolate cyclohydrolase, partial [Candidatus Taylorbacteria bacterium]|nr:bifunctional 5,10-methylenetetrahydrofolate dehydrogenase/5,10-methenyltetrahydrofolate cyclohydrolase [Candidatus Taylorbacteria bacterium]